MDILKIYDDFSNLNIVVNNAVPDCFKNNIGLTGRLTELKEIIELFYNSLNRTHDQLDEVLRKKKRKSNAELTVMIDGLFRFLKFQSNSLILKGNSGLFSEYYSTFRKALGDLFNEFLVNRLLQVSKEKRNMNIYFLCDIHSYLENFCQFLKELKSLIKDLASNPTKTELNNIIRLWNQHIDKYKRPSVACLVDLRNSVVLAVKEDFSANVSKLASQTKEIIAYFQENLGENITVKLSGKNKKKKVLKKIEFD